MKRLKPTVAVAGELQIARLSQASAAEEPRGTERQCARGCALQNNLVVTQPRNAQARHRMGVRPRPRWAGFARACGFLPGPANQDGSKLGFRVQVEGATREDRK